MTRRAPRSARGEGPVEAVFCDIGNVLFRLGSEHLFRDIAAATARPPELIAGYFCVQNITERLEGGELSPRELHSLVKTQLNYPGSLRQLAALWCAHLTPMPGVAAALEEASRRCRLYLLSNTNPFHYAAFLKRDKTIARADGAVLSFRVGLRKPDPEFFKTALRLARVSARRVVYVDDLDANIAAAQTLGLRCIRFRPDIDLRRALARRGVRASES
jgi:HAD superfamily hydrolase (TIGR01509 family)